MVKSVEKANIQDRGLLVSAHSSGTRKPLPQPTPKAEAIDQDKVEKIHTEGDVKPTIRETLAEAVRRNRRELERKRADKMAVHHAADGSLTVVPTTKPGFEEASPQRSVPSPDQATSVPAKADPPRARTIEENFAEVIRNDRPYYSHLLGKIVDMSKHTKAPPIAPLESTPSLNLGCSMPQSQLPGPNPEDRAAPPGGGPGFLNPNVPPF